MTTLRCPFCGTNTGTLWWPAHRLYACVCCILAHRDQAA